MRHVLAVFVTVAIHNPGNASTEALDCAAFLTGEWEARGQVAMFDPPVEVDNSWKFAEDGLFETSFKYLGEDGQWNEQALEGQWTAANGDEAGDCEVTMSIEIETEDFSSFSTSTSTYTFVDDDTFSTFGLEAGRVAK